MSGHLLGYTRASPPVREPDSMLELQISAGMTGATGRLSDLVGNRPYLNKIGNRGQTDPGKPSECPRNVLKNLGVQQSPDRLFNDTEE